MHGERAVAHDPIRSSPGETQKAGPHERAIRNAVCCSHGGLSSGAWPTRCTGAKGPRTTDF